MRCASVAENSRRSCSCAISTTCSTLASNPNALFWSAHCPCWKEEKGIVWFQYQIVLCSIISQQSRLFLDDKIIVITSQRHNFIFYLHLLLCSTMSVFLRGLRRCVVKEKNHDGCMNIHFSHSSCLLNYVCRNHNTGTDRLTKAELHNRPAGVWVQFYSLQLKPASTPSSCEVNYPSYMSEHRYTHTQTHLFWSRETLRGEGGTVSDIKQALTAYVSELLFISLLHWIFNKLLFVHAAHEKRRSEAKWSW